MSSLDLNVCSKDWLEGQNAYGPQDQNYDVTPRAKKLRSLSWFERKCFRWFCPILELKRIVEIFVDFFIFSFLQMRGSRDGAVTLPILFLRVQIFQKKQESAGCFWNSCFLVSPSQLRHHSLNGGDTAEGKWQVYKWGQANQRRMKTMDRPL